MIFSLIEREEKDSTRTVRSASDNDRGCRSGRVIESNPSPPPPPPPPRMSDGCNRENADDGEEDDDGDKEGYGKVREDKDCCCLGPGGGGDAEDIADDLTRAVVPFGTEEEETGITMPVV